MWRPAVPGRRCLQMSRDSTAPLAGYRVVDFSTVVAGPWCTRLLADCGAEVIKVESPGMGDVLRFSEPVVEGQSRVFAHFNCGKKNVCIDLKQPDGVALARTLIASAQIVVENFRPGVMQRFGLDYAAVKSLNPELIYCSVSGFGQTGPLAKAPAYAPVLHAWSGFDHVLRIAQTDHEVPLTGAIMVADYTAANYAFGAIQSAVIRRERFGAGAYIDVSLMDAMLTMVAIQCQEAQSDQDIRSTTFRPVRGKDGYLIIPLVSFKNFRELIAALDLGYKDDPRVETFAGVLALRAEILRALDDWALSRSVEQISDAMQAAGLPCARYRVPKDVINDPALHARRSFAPLRDAAGEFTVVNTPFRLNDGDVAAGNFVARLGEHTDEVLLGLGLEVEEISVLRRRAVIS